MLIDTMGRYVILVSLSTVTNILTLIVFVIRIIHTQTSNEYGNVLYLYGQTNWLIFDVLVNCICVMGQFRFFGSKMYFKCCKICHEKCKSNLNTIALKRKRNENMPNNNPIIKAKSRSDYDQSFSS